jgi:hypothetical protein
MRTWGRRVIIESLDEQVARGLPENVKASVVVRIKSPMLASEARPNSLI